MNSIQHIKGKTAVLVPIKDWEKKEFFRLRNKVNKSHDVKRIEEHSD